MDKSFYFNQYNLIFRDSNEANEKFGDFEGINIEENNGSNFSNSKSKADGAVISMGCTLNVQPVFTVQENDDIRELGDIRVPDNSVSKGFQITKILTQIVRPLNNLS